MVRNMNIRINEEEYDFIQVTYNKHDDIYGYNHGNHIIDAGFNTFEEAEEKAKKYAIENNIDYYDDIDIDEEQIKLAIEHNEFVGVEFYNGQEHTIKAYGNVCGTPYPYADDDGYCGQLQYLKAVCREENTFINTLLTANSEEEAIEEGIIEENGFVK